MTLPPYQRQGYGRLLIDFSKSFLFLMKTYFKYEFLFKVTCWLGPRVRLAHRRSRSLIWVWSHTAPTGKTFYWNTSVHIQAKRSRLRIWAKRWPLMRTTLSARFRPLAWWNTGRANTLCSKSETSLRNIRKEQRGADPTGATLTANTWGGNLLSYRRKLHPKTNFINLNIIYHLIL